MQNKKPGKKSRRGTLKHKTKKPGLDPQFAGYWNLIKTGSSVFGGNNPDDEDWFGLYDTNMADQLHDMDFSERETCLHYGSDFPALGFRHVEKRIDIFLFPSHKEYARYKKAHRIAIEVELRDRYPNKEDFMKIFNAMWGFKFSINPVTPFATLDDLDDELEEDDDFDDVPY